VSTPRENINFSTFYLHSINFIQKPRFFISIYLLLGFILFLTAPNYAFWDDMKFWHDWARYIYQHGIGQIYTDPECNYHPVWLMMLGAETWLKGEWVLEGKHILVAKSWPILFDVIGALGVFLLIKQREGKIWLPLVALLNLAYIYNSWIWFQVDSIYTVFSLFSLAFILRGQVKFALICLTLAINTKLQSIIFFPVFGLLLLPVLFMRPLLVASSLLLALIVQVAILAPFWKAGTLSQLWQVVTNAHHTWSFVSRNAFNLWYLFIPDPMQMSDGELLEMGLTYKQIGFCLFLIFSTVTLLPLTRRCLLWLRTKSMPNLFDAPLVMLSASSVTLVFFFFNTQMHERYSHPAILALFYYGALTRRWWLYGLCSVAYLLNLDQVLHYFADLSPTSVGDFYRLWNLTTGLTANQLPATLYLLVLGWSIWDLYKHQWSSSQTTN
jgi:Gpi18-like mannosyltransferase